MAIKTQPPLLGEWHRCAQKWEKRPGGPYVFPGDEFLVKKEAEEWVCKNQRFAEWVTKPEFGKAVDKRLHLDLLPSPFWGNLERSSVFLLMLNPGVRPSAYYLEENFAVVRQEKLKILRQENGQDNYPFLPLDPQFSWLAAADYWRKKFKRILLTLQEEHRYSYQGAAQLLAQNVACIQLVPYHSKNYDLPRKISQNLAAKQMTLDYVKQVLVPKAEAGEATIIVMRGVKAWGLSNHKNVINYQGSEPVAANLTPQASQAILARILHRGNLP